MAWLRERLGLLEGGEARIHALEQQALSLDATKRAQLLDEAGDLCARENRRQEAMRLFGRSVDAYLQARCYDAAAAVCRKLIRFAPGVIRAHCTLSLLCVGSRRLGDAETEIELYVSAAERGGTVDLAAARLRLMAEVAVDDRVVYAIARHLRRLGDAGGSQRALDLAAEMAQGRRNPPGEERWDTLLAAALAGPDGLRGDVAIAVG